MRSSNGVFKSDNPPTHFFKVILRNDFIDNDILRIPTKFAKKYGSSLSDRVCLEVPGGYTWDVGLQRDDQGLLLRDGWAEFMRHYQIDHGHFIVFRYDGDSRFHIIILDQTACEIEYPVKSPSDEEVPVVEIREEECIRLAVSRKRKSRPPKNSTRVVTREMNGVDNGHLNFNAHNINNPAVKAARDSGALQRASSFKCKNPSSLVVIQPIYVCPRYNLYLSRKFLTACIPNIGDFLDIKLCTSGKKAWIVSCSLRNHKGRPMVFRGWRKFVDDNNLRVGHVCVFEFLGGADTTFHVTIFRAKGAV